jgi:hypothetical protein
MKTYVGKFENGNYRVVIEDDDGTGRINYQELPLRLDLINKSPTGFSWGYNGSGPAQLALALLADAIGDEEALKIYQSFKNYYVVVLPSEWYAPAEEIRDLANHLKTSQDVPGGYGWRE